MVDLNTGKAQETIRRLHTRHIISYDEFQSIMAIINAYEDERNRQSAEIQYMSDVEIINQLYKRGRIDPEQRLSLLGYLNNHSIFDKVKATAILIRLGYIEKVGINTVVDVEATLRSGYSKEPQYKAERHAYFGNMANATSVVNAHP